MRKLARLLLATTAVLTFAPTAASALDSCDAVCSCTSSCSQSCRIGTTGATITCGRWGDCITLCNPPVDMTASVTQDEAQQDDTSAPVCSETQRDAELSVSVES